MRPFLIYISFQVFCQMIKNNIKIKLSDLKNILQTEYDELVFIKKKISSAADFSTEKDIAKVG